jgi:hypothetical protein
MKHSRKMVLVDYDKYIQNQNQRSELNLKPKPLLNLDHEIYNILQRNDLSDYEKQKLYTSKLNKFLFFANGESNEEPTNIAKQTIKKEEEEIVERTPNFMVKKNPEPSSDSDADSSIPEEEFITPRNSPLSKKPKKKKTPPRTPKSEPKTGRRKIQFARLSPITTRYRIKNQTGGWINFSSLLKLKKNIKK